MAEPIVEPAAPAAPEVVTTADGRAYVRTTDGIASVPAEQLGTFLNEGRGELATAADVAANEERKQYGEGLGNTVAATAEGALSGASLGLSDLAAKALAPDYAEGLAKRREYNPTAAGLGEAGGIVAATLLTGGGAGAAEGGLSAGRLGLSAARTVSAPARGLMALGEATTAGASRLLGTEAATGLLGKAVREGVAYGAGGAVEGALFGAAKTATDDFLHDQEITTERILAGAGEGAFTGAVLGAGVGGAMSLVQDGAKAVWPALKKALVDAETLDDFVGERAYKAALGGRNLRDVQRAKRYARPGEEMSGPAEVGKTLLNEGVVTSTSTLDDIARVAREKAEEHGSRIGQIVDELDAPSEGLGHVMTVKPSGQDAMRRIYDEVLLPMKSKPALRDIAEAVERKPVFQNLKEALTRTDEAPLTFRDLWELRRDLDTRLKFEQPPAPFVNPDPGIEVLRSVRRELDQYWQEAGDAAAEAAGKPQLLQEFRDAKRAYSHLKHGEEIAEKAIARDSANRMLSPSDYGFGAVVAGADAITGGGASLGTLVYGLASGAVHKFFRERGSAMFAGTMHQLRGAPKLVRDARAGEQAVESAAKGVIASLADRAKAAAKRAPYAAPLAAASRALSSPEVYEQAARKAAELSDPNSSPRQGMKRQAALVRVHYPALANAMDAKAQAVGDFIAAKAGPASATPKAGDPFGHIRKPRHDPAKATRLARYVEAATNPNGVLERVGKGELLREDMEVLQTLYPRLYQRVRDEVLMNLSKVDELPSYEARLKLGHLLNAPTDPSMRPEMVQALQQLARSGLGAKAAQEEQQGPMGEQTLSPSQRRAPKSASMFTSRTDAQSVEGSRLGG